MKFKNIVFLDYAKTIISTFKVNVKDRRLNAFDKRGINIYLQKGK